MGTAEIKKMSPAERLRTMELLWDALAHDAASVPSPAWHEQVIAARMERIRSGRAKFLTVEETKERLKSS